MKIMKIAVLVGSLRKESYNRKIAMVLKSLAPDALKLEIIEIGQLPLYNEDLDASPPVEWVNFRNLLSTFDGVLFVTPEYNRSFPAVLKNALDVGSRPYGENGWSGKPGAVISVSIGGIGGFGANHHLRQVLTFLNVPTLQQPEAYLGNVGGLFDDKGNLVGDSILGFLKGFLNSYAIWVERNRP